MNEPSVAPVLRRTTPELRGPAEVWLAGVDQDELLRLRQLLADAGLPTQTTSLLGLMEPDPALSGVLLVDLPAHSEVRPTTLLERLRVPEGVRLVALVEAAWVEAVLGHAGVHDGIARPVRAPELAGRLRVAARVAPDAPVGTPGSLTARELAFVELLRSEAGCVFTRIEILRRLWPPGFDGSDRVVDTLVGRIRRKLGVEAAGIRTVRRVGYKVVDRLELYPG